MTDRPERAPRRTRVIGVLALLFGAPVFAELIQSYLDITGELGGTLFLIAFMAPLYGGVALLVREVAVRTRRGWPGRLLLAAAFGVLMPTWVDLSLWTPQKAEEIELWGDIRGVTIAGVSVLALSSWALGHVVMSIGAPLVVVEALLPAGRGRPWLGWFGITVLGILAVGVAVLIHFDEEGPAAETSLTKYALSLALAAALSVAAFTPLGRPLTPLAGRGTAGPLVLGVAGFVLMAAFDLAPASWLGLVLVWGALVVAVVLLLRWARSPEWTGRHVAAFAFGGILERTLIGFLVPTPPGGDATGKLVQNVVVLLLVLGLGALLRVRTREPAPERDVLPAQ
ncbi:MAG: hypothetical protein ABWX73_02120 [Marmoricola sp.]